MRYERDLLAKQVQELPAQRQAVMNDAALNDSTRARQLAELDRLTQRYTRMTTADNGPLVFFVFRPGYPARIRELQQQIKALGADPVAVSRKTEIEAQLQQLELWQTFANRQRGLDMEKSSLDSAVFTDEGKRTEKKADIEERQAQLERERQAAGGQGPALPEQDVAFNFTLVPDCGAIPSMVIFLAAVLAFPARWWKRLVGLAGGIAILYCVNALLRLPCLAVIGALNGGGKWFDFAHHYVWQGIYIVFVVLVWLAWVEYIVRGKERGEDPAR
jgi:exosortase/archaeosortase family protein